MNVKRVLSALLLSCIFCSTYAQSEHFLGFRSGMNFSKFQSTDLNTSMKPGVLVGFTWRWKFDPAWSLYTDVIYSARGAKHDNPTTTSVGASPSYTVITHKNNFNSKFTYIDVPVVFSYRLPIFSKANIAPYYNTDPVASFNIYGGVNTGYLFKASQSGSITQVTDEYNSDTLTGSTSERIIVDNELDSGFSSIDIDAVLGVGMLFNTGNGRRIFIDVRYNIGVTSINDGHYTKYDSDGDPFMPDIRTKTFQLTFGMLFSTRKRVR